MGKRRNTTRKSLRMESLEARQLMAADIGLSNGLLSIEGTDYGDIVRVSKVYVRPEFTSNRAASRFLGARQQGNPRFQRAPLVARVNAVVANMRGRVLKQAQYSLGAVSSIKVQGLAGNDNLQNSTNIPSELYGGAGNDMVRGGFADDIVSGSTGDDQLWGGDGHDTIYGGRGDDTIEGGLGNDRIFGHEGADTIHGQGGDDELSGQSGDDVLWGGSDDDLLNGGSGNDTLYGNYGDDTLNGDDGDDMLQGGKDNDILQGGKGKDVLSGGHGKDVLKGEAGADMLSGGTHNDDLYGGTGRDFLDGGSGDDGMFGGVDGSFDFLKGGIGDDRFLTYGRHWSATSNGRDFLMDRNSNDAVISFHNGQARRKSCEDNKSERYASGSFTNEDIERIDEALADLHHQTRNTKLLKRANGQAFSFERLGSRTSGTCRVGTLGWNSDANRKITLVDGAFTSPIPLSQIVFHEVGHNWENENAKWHSWKKISGWRSSSKRGYVASTDGDWFHKRSATFARNYGKTNPYEDFATYFAKVMMDDSGRTYEDDRTGSTNTKKERFMDTFFASLA